MRLSVLLLAVGMIAAPCIASAQPKHVPTQTNPCPGGSGGPLNVYILNFEPEAAFKNAQGYTSPTSSTPLTPGTAMANDLKQAFAISPPFFQRLLCSLDGVFINTDGCSNFDYTNDVCQTPGDRGLSNKQTIDASWGFREAPSLFPQGKPAQYNRYVAISAGPWYQPGNSAPNYRLYEQKILDELLPWRSDTIAKPTYLAANTGADIAAMAVLAALAHELGHVLWYDKFRPDPGGAYDWSTFCHGTFFANSWRRVDAPPTWRSFGTVQNSHHPSATAIPDIFTAMLHQDFSSAGNLMQGSDQIQGIFAANGRWASMFAAFSPDEDFVETFKLYVLTKAVGADSNNNPHALRYLAIDVSGSTKKQYNIPDDYSNGRKSELTRKMACIQEEFNSSP